MARPMWLVGLLKKNFKNRFFLAGLTQNNSFYRRFINWLVFEDDLFFYLPKDLIVVNQVIPPQSNMAIPSDVVRHFIESGAPIFVMNQCICRESSACTHYPIDIGCIFIGEAVHKISPRLGRRVSKTEALEHLEHASAAGLVHSIGRNKLDTLWLGATPGHQLLTICHCCQCCCLYRVLPNLDRSISSKITHMPGIRVSVNPQACTGCGACVKVCMPTACAVVDGKSVINDLCIGCGRCVETCPQQAITLNIENDQFIEDTIRMISEKVDVTHNDSTQYNLPQPSALGTSSFSLDHPVEHLPEEVNHH